MSSSVGSIGNFGGFSFGSSKDYSNKTDSQLRDILSGDNPKEDKLEALFELLKRTPPKQSSGEEDDIMTLLMKLLSGQISPEELKKLAEMLGVSPSALEGLKGSQKEESGDIK